MAVDNHSVAVSETLKANISQVWENEMRKITEPLLDQVYLGSIWRASHSEEFCKTRPYKLIASIRWESPKH
jgi:hypothetical protein